MKLTVNNYRGIESAEIEIAPIALVAGKNGAGKTSIAQAAAAVMTGNAAPVDGFKKNEAAKLVRDGQKTGKASIDGAKITFPRGNVSGEGPRGSAVAAGLDHPLDMKPADSARFLSTLLNAEPTQDDLTEALPDIDAAVIDKIWDAIKANGWDAAHRQSKETGIKRKGQWEMVTGVNYGTKVAANWVPPEFDGGVPDRESLVSDLESAKSKHAELMASRAVSASMVERNQADAERLDDARALMAELSEEKTNLTAELKTAEVALHDAITAAEQLPQPGTKELTVPCPECGTHLVILSRSELKASGMEGPTDEENEARQLAINESTKAINELRRGISDLAAKVSATDRKIFDASQTITTAENATEWLKTANTNGATDEQIEAAQHAIDDVSYQLSLIDNMEKAATLAESIKQSALISAALAPDGVRKIALARALGDANERMYRLCSVAKFPAVAINEDLTFSYGEREYRLLSESEAYRVRFISQLYIAMIDGSNLIVIDRADLLDKSGRTGLIKAVRCAAVPALICMTLDEPMVLPESVGRAYWVEGAHCA